MTESKPLERRMLLRGAGVAGASLAGVAAVPAVASAHGEDHHGSRVLGAWLITHTDNPPGDPTPVQAVTAFADGGVFISQDIAPTSTAQVGAWKAHGDSFRVTFWTGDNGDAQQPAVRVQVRVRGTVHHDTISGTYTLTIYAATAQTVVGTGSGTFSGTRVRP